MVSSNRKVFLATFALDKVDQYEGNPRQSLNSGSTPWIPDSLSLELGFRIPIVSGIPDSFSCKQDSNSHNSGFHKTSFQDSGFQVVDSGFPVSGTWIPDSNR